MFEKPILPRMSLALGFGLAAFACVYGGLTIPIPTTQMIMDPREIFVTVGAALTGPLGAVLIGVLAGSFDPVAGFWPVSMAMHVSGSLWMSLQYKKILVQRLPRAFLVPGWFFSTLVFYGVFMIPIMVFTCGLFPDLFSRVFPDSTRLQALLAIYSSALPEVLLTSTVTTLILVLLPANLRKPLW